MVLSGSPLAPSLVVQLFGSRSKTKKASGLQPNKNEENQNRSTGSLQLFGSLKQFGRNTLGFPAVANQSAGSRESHAREGGAVSRRCRRHVRHLGRQAAPRLHRGQAS